jgi:hypothetical protein
MNECVDHMLVVAQQSATTVAAEDPLKGEGLRQAAATGDSDKVRDLMANNEPVDAQDAVSKSGIWFARPIRSLFPKSRRAEEERLFPMFAVRLIGDICENTLAHLLTRLFTQMHTDSLELQDGRTALHLAAKNGHSFTAMLLMDCGADIRKLTEVRTSCVVGFTANSDHNQPKNS